MLDPKQPSSQQVQLQPDLAADLLSLGRRRKACIYEGEQHPIPWCQGPTSQKPKPLAQMATDFCPLKHSLPWQEKVAQTFSWKRKWRGGEG